MLPLYTTVSIDDPPLSGHLPSSGSIGKRSKKHLSPSSSLSPSPSSSPRDPPSIIPIHWARRLFPSLFRPFPSSKRKMDRREEKGLVKALEDTLRKNSSSELETNPFISEPVRIPPHHPSSSSLSSSPSTSLSSSSTIVTSSSPSYSYSSSSFSLLGLKAEEAEHFALTPLSSCTSLVSFDDVVLEDDPDSSSTITTTTTSSSLPTYSPPPSYPSSPEEDTLRRRASKSLDHLNQARLLLEDGPCGPDRAWRVRLAYHILDVRSPSPSSSSVSLDPSMIQEVQEDLWGLSRAPSLPSDPSSSSSSLHSDPLPRSIRANSAEERMLASERLMMLHGKIVCPLKDRSCLPPRPLPFIRSSSLLSLPSHPHPHSYCPSPPVVEDLLDDLPSVL
ncbi:MAG: hypothetical protein DHS80DRAFT_21415 [Piptocephalis tieghemiana]|nr:MAG: hypothetical protein DHS80DRAFT_21415 [Piptocephalis tieghemiana]